MLKNKLLVFNAPFATALLSTYLANFMISTFQNINFQEALITLFSIIVYFSLST